MPAERTKDPSSGAVERDIEDLRDVNERLFLSILREQESLDFSERERAQLNALLEALHDGVLIAGADGRIKMLNGAARRIIGLRSADASPDDVAAIDLRRADMTALPASERPVSQALRGTAVVDHEMLLVSADGKVRRLLTTCTSAGDGALAFMVFRDITERRQLDERLARTERLAALGTLSAGVAHEINNPLSYIVWNVEGALAELRSAREDGRPASIEKLEEMLVDAEDGANRVTRIVAGLRTFSRFHDARRSVVDVRAVLDRSADLASNEIRHRARLVRQYEPVPLVHVDEARLGQVFLNLVINAAYAIQDGASERNEVRLITSTNADGNAVVEIRDTGEGIAPEDMPHIFDPFFTPKAVSAGTGLGLSICHTLVHGMRGEITASTPVGGGTTFRIVLPKADRPPEPALAAHRSAEATVRRATVLVVDDEPLIGKALRRILTGHDVTVVTRAADALALIEGGLRFDIVFSDLMMPEKSGMELYDELARASPAHAERMVFISGGAFTPTATAFLERVPNDRLSKPFDAHAIRALVENCRTRRQR